MKKNKDYKYLISYCYEYQILNSEIKAIETSIFNGTGCVILSSSFKIQTEDDIKETNKNLMNIVKLNDNQKLISVHLYSFNLLKG